MKGVDLKIPGQIKNAASRSAGKIAIGAGVIAAGRHIPKIYEQHRAVKTGVEINTKDRLKKKNKK